MSRSGGKLAGAALRDRVSGTSFTLRATLFVNACGPWVDDMRRLDDPAAAPCVRLTKGVHLIFRHESIPVRESLVLSDAASRIVFVIPRDGYVMVGTTDTDFDGDRERVCADRTDVEYLLGVVRESLPGVRAGAGDVVSSFAGLRALVHPGGAQAPSSVPREETILESATGLISVAGGKLTTHREIAEHVVDRVMARLSRAKGTCPTLETPLIGARPVDDDGRALAALAPQVREDLLGRYGTRAAMVADLIAEHPELAQPLAPGCPVIAAEVIHAVRNELARTVADFIVRRTALSWRYPLEAVAAAATVADLMGSELRWDQARQEAELGDFRTALARAQAA